MLISLLFLIKVIYFKVIYSVENKISWIFFESFYLTNERFDEFQAQEKSPTLKNYSLRACS